MTKLTLELPDSVFSATREDPVHLSKQLVLAAAVLWYSQGRISQEVAATLAGMDRTDFLMALARMGIDSFIVDFHDLEKELSRG
ncbi:MAG: UPF0175 family protein [Verrucomicrobiae bacterium]|nr:UPF0175 family protein [Verrucomicrobiae bacterium]